MTERRCNHVTSQSQVVNDFKFPIMGSFGFFESMMGTVWLSCRGSYFRYCVPALGVTGTIHTPGDRIGHPLPQVCACLRSRSVCRCAGRAALPLSALLSACLLCSALCRAVLTVCRMVEPCPIFPLCSDRLWPSVCSL